MKDLLHKDVPTDFIIKVAVWVIGEVGSRLYAANSQQLDALFKIVNQCFDLDL